MNDRSDGNDEKKGWKPRDGKAEAPGEKRVFKPRPLGASPRPAAGPQRKSYPTKFDTDAPGMADKARSSDRKPRDDARPGRSPAPETDEPAGSMRIAKRLARAGIASRRDAEGMIADGRIKVNGKVLDTPALVVTGKDRIEVDNQPLTPIERTRLWLFHKPAGVVTTNRDPEGRPTVFDRLPEDLPRVLSVGRLDINTEGLLLLTNDGGLARILELPATGWLRRYRVRAHGTVTQAQLDALRQGIAVDGVFYGAIEATLDSEKGANVWLTLGLREGKNREVKRILGHLGLDVNRLIRLSFGPFQLGDIPEGAVREINGRMLRDQLGDRLIEESGADFDAPIINTFTNETVQAEKKEEAPKPKSEWVSAAGERPNKKKFGDAKRTDALGRMDTRPPRPDRDARPSRDARPARDDRPSYSDRPPRDDDRPRASKPGEEAEAPKKPTGPRRMANVWMAPGARPIGEKKAAVREERAKGRGDRPKPVFGKARSDDGARPARGPGAPRPQGAGGASRSQGAAGAGDRPKPRPLGDGPRSRPSTGDGPRSRPGSGDAPRSRPGAPRDGAKRGPSDGPKRGPRS
ncbi:pseudouridine synthase [Aureimonas sp. SA4125]|uniref:pseudouridine synthase n=1 Tax=Aureimonas sp. SA4125 TaxID=2826993 RepID=UPI001E6B4AE0|nr:pseudouridine synthase [Aureimonas sp. SA4125]